LPKELIKQGIKFLVNPTGRFVIGGPQGDCGLTAARSSWTPTVARHRIGGGGAFSGKDPSKVDRSAAYASRYVAKKTLFAAVVWQQVPGADFLLRSACPNQPV